MMKDIQAQATGGLVAAMSTWRSATKLSDVHNRYRFRLKNGSITGPNDFKA
jgi:hypothetical protein